MVYPIKSKHHQDLPRYAGHAVEELLALVLTDLELVRQRLVVDHVHRPLGRDRLLHRVHVHGAACGAAVATDLTVDVVGRGVGVVQVHEDG